MGNFTTFEIKDHVAYITLNRPEKRNAINRAMRKELQEAYARVKTDREIWAVIMTGNGEAFSSGRDLSELERPGNDDGSVMTTDELCFVQRFIYKPIVVALNGPCLAQAAGMAENADIVIFSERASIGWPHVKRGITSVSGPSFLANAIPWNQAMAVLMRGGSISANQALQLGMANEVVPHDQLSSAAERWVREILENAPLAVQAIKEAARRGQELHVMDRVYLARSIMNRMLLTEDAREGLLAFKEKRKPVWKGM